MFSTQHEMVQHSPESLLSRFGTEGRGGKVFQVLGTIENRGPNELVSSDDVFDVSVLNLSRTLGGGIAYELLIEARPPEAEPPVVADDSFPIT